MKKSIHWVMAALMAFEPALATEANAKIQAELQAEFRRFIELSGVTQKEVTFRELHEKFQSFLPKEEAERLKPLVEAFGNVKLPKMQVGKIKTPVGNSAYKLSFTQSGSSGDLEFFGEAQTVYRMNGKNFPSEKITLNELSQSLNLPANIAANLFPVKNNRRGYLSAEEVAELSKEDQKKYIHDFQALLASAEQAQRIETPKKTASILENSPFFVKLLNDWMSPEAQALDVGKNNCTVGGHISDVAVESGGRRKCGTIPGGKGTLPAIKGDCSGTYDVRCNTALFGPEKICVPAGESTTAECMSKAKDNDIPDFANRNAEGTQARDKFNELKTKAEEQIIELMKVCATVNGMRIVGKNSGIIKDQQSTCANLKLRKETIASWGCDNKDSEFAKKYQNICKKREEAEVAGNGFRPPGAAANAPVLGVQPATQPQAQQPPVTTKKCTDLGYTISESQISCSIKGTSPARAPNDTKCLADNGDMKETNSLWFCACSKENKPDPKTGCAAAAAGTGAGAGDSWFSKVGSWFSKNSKMLTWLGLGLVGLYSFYWLSKQQAKQYYNWMNPTVPNPPVVPNGSAPVPRSTQ